MNECDLYLRVTFWARDSPILQKLFIQKLVHIYDIFDNNNIIISDNNNRYSLKLDFRDGITKDKLSWPLRVWPRDDVGEGVEAIRRVLRSIKHIQCVTELD